MTRLQKTFLVWLFLSISTFDAYLFTTLNFQRQRVHLGHAAQPWQECSLLMLMFVRVISVSLVTLGCHETDPGCCGSPL